jgi:rhodanese-related sulfurtransferase
VIRNLINLPFKVLGRVSRAVQDRNDSVVQQKYGKGDERVDWESHGNIPVYDMPADYNPGHVLLPAAEAVAWRRSGKEVVFCDVRGKAAYDAGHVTGTEHIPASQLPIRLAELPPEGTRVVVYSDDPQEALMATKFLRFRGLDDAWSLEGGYRAWVKAGGPTG